MAVKVTPHTNVRDPKDAAKCPVHGTRMAYNTVEEVWYCSAKNKSGEPCGFQAHPRVADPTMLHSTQYKGAIRVYAAQSATETGEEGTAIFLMLTELGLAIDITAYIDVSGGDDVEPIVVKPDQSCTLAMAFSKIDFARTD